MNGHPVVLIGSLYCSLKYGKEMVMSGRGIEWKMVRKIALLLLLGSLVAGNAPAAQFGIGLTANQTDQTLYVPIKITDSLRTELSFGIASAEQKTDESKEQIDQYEAGIGLFFSHEVYEKTQLYYGCRLTYLSAEREYETDGGREYNYSRTGYRIAPTLGFEYFFTPHLSLGGEAEFYYESLDGEEDDDRDSIDVDETVFSTDSRLVLRFYF